MLSILHVSQPVDAGVANAVADLATAQQAAGWKVTVAAPAGGQLQATLERAGIHHLPWQASRNPSLSMATELRDLRRIIDAEQPELVHLHSSKAGLVGRLAIRGKRPTIFQPHGWSFCVASGPARSIITLSERLATRWTDLVVCVSEDERELATRYGLCGDRAISRSTRWTVVCNGVDTQRFRPPSEQEAATARDRLGLAAGAAVVCVGRIARQKGQDILLDAWPDVLRSVPDATLYVVGDGPDRAQLEAQGVPGVCFVGPWDDVRSWLWAADVVALPSRWEGLAYTLLEAMACGRSVVAADATGMRQALVKPIHERRIDLAGPQSPEPVGAGVSALAGAQVGAATRSGLGTGPTAAPPVLPVPDLPVARVATTTSVAIPPAGAVVPIEAAPELAGELVQRLASPSRREAEGRAARRRVIAEFSLHESLEEICRRTSALI